jgi:myo-inositol-1(or 4)-monophosphatase
MKNSAFSSLTLTAIQAALKAGDIVRKGFGTAYEITAKPGRQNFVTEYDRASEGCIISFIKERFPSHSLLAEESGFSSESEEENVLWIIDPLDGTSNFAHHIPIFTISIAAYRQKKGLCGVIFQPITHELFVAESGKGAYLNGTRLTVSQTNTLEECLIVAGLPYDATSVPILDMEQLLRISQNGVTLRNFGSAALSLAYIAAGKVDALWMYNLYPWDLAAGALLIKEAGGLLTLYERDQSVPYSASNILASNKAMHSLLQEYLLYG